MQEQNTKKAVRQISTGLKPATAVRLKSLPWSFNQINSEVATTATSHSRRTAEGIPQYMKIQHNFQKLDGTKPQTSSVNGQYPNSVIHMAQYENLALQSNQSQSKEDDIFSNITVSINNGYSQHTPNQGSKMQPAGQALSSLSSVNGQNMGINSRGSKQRVNTITPQFHHYNYGNSLDMDQDKQNLVRVSNISVQEQRLNNRRPVGIQSEIGVNSLSSNSVMDIVSAKGSANNNRMNVNGDYSSSSAAAANNHGSFNIPQRSLTVNSGNYQAISNNLPQKMINKLKERKFNQSRLAREENNNSLLSQGVQSQKQGHS